MNPNFRSALILTLAAALSACASEPPAANADEGSEEAAAGTLQTDEQKILYAVGQILAQQLGPFSLTADELTIVQDGLTDAITDADSKVSLEEYGPKIQAFVQERAAAAAKVESEAAASFLEKTAAEDGVTKTESGLLFKEIQAGTGANPAATDTVTVHYHGTLRSGKVFDSSRDRGEPATFTLNQVIPCWTEGLQKIKVGGKAKLICPPALAYGAQGAPPVIPPEAALVFEVELLSIGAPTPPTPPAPAAPAAPPTQ
jgi:FKBP-type peptidyl-prolyl cis-trans isomerase FkpA